MLNVIVRTDFEFPGQKDVYHGKVRDVYTIRDQYLVMVASNRISAFDVILPRPIPYKGQVLNQIAAFMLSNTKDICPNWLIDVPAPNASIGHLCIPFKIEMVVRGNLVGHAWRTYQTGRILCGQTMPEGLMENDFFPTPLITPSTKAAAGHDEDISLEEIKNQKLLKKKQIDQIEAYALSLFDYGQKRAENRNLILVDTKYEFGELNDQIMLIDEIHTPDSSRYFYKDTYEQIQSKDQQQRQLSKEFVRKWLIENGFQGRDGELVPYMSDEYIESVSLRYIELYEQITGEGFQKRDYTHISEVIENRVNEFISAHLS